MPYSAFQHVRVWVFDLDNTLYPPEIRLFDQIEARMTDFVARALGLSPAAADRVRRDYWAEYGTTLAGLMERHGTDPVPFLTEVHDITLDGLRPDPVLRARLSALPGRRIVHTNGSAAHGERVLAARGIEDAFDAVYGIEQTGFQPKPRRAAFEAVAAAEALDPTRAAFFEDDPRNLAVPFEMGMRTVHVARDAAPAGHIHHHTDDLTGFLAALAR